MSSCRLSNKARLSPTQRPRSSKSFAAYAIYWRAELHRLRGQLDQAEADFRLAYASAQQLRAGELAGEAMLGLTRVAGARGDIAQLESWAFVAAAVFAERPDKHAELLGVQGLALVESGPAEHERGLALLREAVAMREARQRSGSRAKLGQSLEALGRGLLGAGRDEEALEVVSETLAIYEDELGEMSRDAHEVRRLLFVAQVKNRQLDECYWTTQSFRHEATRHRPG